MDHVGSIALKSEPTQTGLRRKLPSTESAWLLGMLMSLAVARRESLSTEDYEVYCRALSGFPQELLRGAIESFILEPRGTFDKPFPTTGDIAERCREEAKKKPVKSKFCGRCMDGYVRLGREVVMCECCCKQCGGIGFTFLERNGERFARPCDVCRTSPEVA